MMVIRTGRGRLLGLILLSSGFVAAGFWFSVGLPIRPAALRIPLWILGLASILFFGVCGGAYLRRLLGHRVALMIGRSGILDNSSGTPAGPIPWKDILRVGIVTQSNARFVAIDVHDREELFARARHSRVLKENAALFEYPVLIPEVVLDRPAERLVAEIEDLRRDPKAREQLGELEA
jgi:hypothetical protein